MRRATVIQWLLSLLAFSVLLGLGSFFFWVHANPQQLTTDLSLSGNRAAIIADHTTSILLDTNAGYITDATLTVAGSDSTHTQPFDRSVRPWRMETTWHAPAVTQPYTLTAHFTIFDGTTITSSPLFVDVVPAGDIAYVEEPAEGGASSVYVMRTDSSNRRLWAEDATEPAWGPDGALYFVHGGAVWKQTSAEAPAEQLAGTQIGVVAFSLGDPIALVDRNGRLVLRNADGTVAQVPLEVDTVEDVAWRPDGKELLLAATRNGNTDLYLWSPTANNTLQQITDDDASDTQPAWSPDGTRILFASDRSGQHQVYWKAVPPQTGMAFVTELPFGAQSPGWAPTGRWIIYTGQFDEATASTEIILRPLDKRYAVQITRTDVVVHSPAWRTEQSQPISGEN